MRYSLVIVNSKDDFFEINDIFKSLQMNPNSLLDINVFTSSFKDEIDLVSFLSKSHYLPNKYLNGTPKIAFYKSNDVKPKILEYGVAYSSDSYLFDLGKLKIYYTEHLTDINFMTRFINRYFNYYRETKHLSSDILYLNYALNTYKQTKYLPERSFEAMTSFVHKCSTTKNMKNEEVISFRKLRDLAMFAANYEKEQLKIKNSYNDEMTLDYLYSIIKEDNITDEQREMYEKEIETLENRINPRGR